MRLLKYFDFILEEKSELKGQMRYSPELRSKLEKIGGKVAAALLDLEETDQEFTYIDLGEKDNTITFVEVDKVFDYMIGKKLSPGYLSRFISMYWLEKEDVRHIELKIGKFAKILLHDTFSAPEYGDFVDKWRSLKDDSIFELWKGEDIMHAYSSENYEECSGSPLDNSCMNDSEYVRFYSAIEGCEVLVLLDEDRSYGPTIKARALVWTDHEGRRIMDRVYYNFSKDYQKFLNWAKENGVYYKTHNVGGACSFVIGGENVNLNTKIKCPNVFRYAGEGFPYMDTFCYAQGEWLMNYEPEEGKFYKLQDTDGGFDDYNNLYDIYGDEIEEGDENKFVFSKYQNGYIFKDDATHLQYDGGKGFESYSLDDWFEREFVETGIPHSGKRASFVEIDGKWYMEKHCVYSEREGRWIWRPEAIYDRGEWISYDNFNSGK